MDTTYFFLFLIRLGIILDENISTIKNAKALLQASGEVGLEATGNRNVSCH